MTKIKRIDPFTIATVPLFFRFCWSKFYRGFFFKTKSGEMYMCSVLKINRSNSNHLPPVWKICNEFRGGEGITYGNNFLDKVDNLAQKKWSFLAILFTNDAETERSFKIFAAILICLEHRKKIKMHIDDFLDKDHNLAKKMIIFSHTTNVDEHRVLF